MTGLAGLNDRTIAAVKDPANTHPILVAKISDDEAEQLLLALQSAGVRIYVMDGRQMRSEEGFFEQLSSALGWNNMGRNWNAVLDQLRDIPSLPSNRGSLAIFRWADQVLQDWPERIDILINVFQQAAKERAVDVGSTEPTPFHLLLMTDNVTSTVGRWGSSATVV